MEETKSNAEAQSSTGKEVKPLNELTSLPVLFRILKDF